MFVCVKSERTKNAKSTVNFIIFYYFYIENIHNFYILHSREVLIIVFFFLILCIWFLFFWCIYNKTSQFLKLLGQKQFVLILYSFPFIYLFFIVTSPEPLCT